MSVRNFQLRRTLRCLGAALAFLAAVEASDAATVTTTFPVETHHHVRMRDQSRLDAELRQPGVLTAAVNEKAPSRCNAPIRRPITSAGRGYRDRRHPQRQDDERRRDCRLRAVQRRWQDDELGQYGRTTPCPALQRGHSILYCPWTSSRPIERRGPQLIRTRSPSLAHIDQGYSLASPSIAAPNEPRPSGSRVGRKPSAPHKVRQI